MNDWKWYALGSALFAGLTAVCAKVGVEKIPSNLATLLRTLVVAVMLAVVVAVRAEWINPARLPGRSVLFLGLSALATGLSWMCYYRALQTGPVSVVASIDKLSLLVAMGLAVLALGERPNAIQWTGAALLALGAVLVGIK